MFCPSCGEELREDNQRFCHTCGINLLSNIDGPQQYTKVIQKTPNSISKSNLKNIEIIKGQQGHHIKIERIGPYSKKSLAYSIVSLGLTALAIVFISTGFVYSLIRNNIQLLIIPRTIFVISINIVGLVFGIQSKKNSLKAGRFEEINAVEKVGSVLCIFGIVANIIGIIIGFLIYPASMIILNNNIQFIY